MPDQMTTTRLARQLGVTPETIRNRAKAVEEHLSDGARCVRPGAKMVFDMRDVAIMRRVHDLSDGGRTYDDINRVIGEEVEAGLFETLVDTALISDVNDGQYSTRVEYEQRIGQYTAALAQAQNVIEGFKRQIAEKDETILRLKHQVGQLEGEISELRRQISRSDTREEEIRRLNREIGGLEVQIEMLNRQLGKHESSEQQKSGSPRK